MKALEIKAIKTLVINGKNLAAGNPDSLLRYARRIIRRDKLENPNVCLLKGMVLRLEQEV